MSQSTHLRAVVSSRRGVTRKLWVVRVLPEKRLACLPGQYVTIGLPDGRRMIERPYSVPSLPRESVNWIFSWNWFMKES